MGARDGAWDGEELGAVDGAALGACEGDTLGASGRLASSPWEASGTAVSGSEKLTVGWNSDLAGDTAEDTAAAHAAAVERDARAAGVEAGRVRVPVAATRC